MTHNFLTPLCAAAASLVLSACAVNMGDTTPTEEQQQALIELEQDYNAGNYAQVAQTVGLSVALQTAAPTVHIKALKLQAFSYCLQDSAYQCKRSFDRLLQQYPAFDLTASERDHPMWGPVFAKAKTDAMAQHGAVPADSGKAVTLKQ